MNENFGSQAPLAILFGGNRFVPWVPWKLKKDLGWRGDSEDTPATITDKEVDDGNTILAHWNGRDKPWHAGQEELAARAKEEAAAAAKAAAGARTTVEVPRGFRRAGTRSLEDSPINDGAGSLPSLMGESSSISTTSPPLGARTPVPVKAYYIWRRYGPTCGIVEDVIGEEKSKTPGGVVLGEQETGEEETSPGEERVLGEQSRGRAVLGKNKGGTGRPETHWAMRAGPST